MKSAKCSQNNKSAIMYGFNQCLILQFYGIFQYLENIIIMSNIDIKPKPRNHSLLGIKESISTDIRDHVGDRDSANKIRISEGTQMRSKRKIYRPSTATKKREAPETPLESKTVQIVKYDENILKRILVSGKQLREYMESNKITEEQAVGMVGDPLVSIQVEIFASANNLLQGETQTYKQIQLFLIEKMRSRLKFIRQIKACESIEGRINNMISQRINQLNKL